MRNLPLASLLSPSGFADPLTINDLTLRRLAAAEISGITLLGKKAVTEAYNTTLHTRQQIIIFNVGSGNGFQTVTLNSFSAVVDVMPRRFDRR